MLHFTTTGPEFTSAKAECMTTHIKRSNSHGHAAEVTRRPEMVECDRCKAMWSWKNALDKAFPIVTVVFDGVAK